jgi:hypothetical protein
MVNSQNLILIAYIAIMPKYLSLILFLLVCEILSYNLNLNAQKKPEKKSCPPSNQFFIEPYNSIFRDERYTFGLSKSYFIGTGGEFHKRGHGKIVKKF